MTDIQAEITVRLFEMQDIKYRDFQAKLIPTIDREKIIGVRTPDLRKYAKQLSRRDDKDSFLNSLPHKYFEENALHSFIISEEKDFDTAIAKTEKFLPYIDNWATCDQFIPKVFAKNTEKLLPRINEWIASDKTYTVRYAVGLLLKFFLDEKFTPEYLETAASVKSEEYYINMMIAWFFAEALAKQYEDAAVYIEKRRLNKFTHNKAIQKAIESYRISDEKKAYLKTLKIK